MFSAMSDAQQPVPRRGCGVVGPLAERGRTWVTLQSCAARQRRAASAISADGLVVRHRWEAPQELEPPP